MKLIYHISFNEPIDGQKDFFFSSVSGIFAEFSRDQLVVARQTIYQKRLQPGDEYRTVFCIIKKNKLIK